MEILYHFYKKLFYIIKWRIIIYCLFQDCTKGNKGIIFSRLFQKIEKLFFPNNNDKNEEEKINVEETDQLKPIQNEGINEDDEENDEDNDEEKNYLIKILDKVKLQIKNKNNKNKNLGKIYYDMVNPEDD